MRAYRVPSIVAVLLAAVAAAATLGTTRPAAADGAAWAWGYNNWGQVGDGTTANRSTPITVSGLGSGVTAVAAGGYHGLAIVNGAVWGWGHNSDGQVGNGSTTDQLTPVPVSGLPSGTVTAITGGDSHSLAIVNGGAWAWGWGGNGQLGNGSYADQHTAVAVSGLSTGVTAIAAGMGHSLAIENGAVWAWGYNSNGELGSTAAGSFANNPVAADVLTSGVTAIASGSHHNLAVMNGGLYTWGANWYGALGDGTTTAHTTPTLVTGFSKGVTSVAGGFYHSLAVKNGGVWAWGHNRDGQLGDGTTTDSLTPEQIDPTDLTTITAVAAGNDFSFALSSDGSLWEWGYGLGLGLGSNGVFLSPTHVLPPTGYRYTAIDADSTSIHAVALLSPVQTLTPGDANGDGVVDIFDLNVLLTNFDKTGFTWSQGDFDGNGAVDILDLNKVLTNFDKTFRSSAGVTAVPEPAALALLVPLAGSVLACSRRRRGS
jgi:alpha-tubulin suppressor-like RCC1 family protein